MLLFLIVKSLVGAIVLWDFAKVYDSSKLIINLYFAHLTDPQTPNLPDPRHYKMYIA